MRSGNGRHRRPRQAPALVVAAGVTGSAIALPLLGAGTASAADAATWDRVAECETGGMWSADLGNGYYGGLQFSQETWQAYGGTAYAPRADLASRSQQIAVAEKVFAARGSAAWETCAPIAGLAGAGDPAPAETGPGATPEPSAGTGADAGASKEPAAPAKAATEGATTPSGTAEGGGKTTAPAAPDATATPSDDPADPAASGDAPAADGGTGGSASGTGRHRGEPAKEEAATAPTVPGATDESGESGGSGESVESDNTVSGRENGRHTSRGDGTARTAEGLAADGTYTVQPGDNLWAIADTHELAGGWPALYDANRETVGTDPDLILPGQSLDLGVNEG
ncbi:transglycosylase family protein [Streptomyces sp. TRM76323]|uniref:Transglycosylase family protein n=1 Tax=Streptomyces tamarix TaxID=3078565 RepID=A0ABU3QUK1_9ACTN|nr:transglycosylase family protein [Streptomyces tamarix]MDT9686017.1 transglycosylase family protein [Streptomyces tamarix]